MRIPGFPRFAVESSVDHSSKNQIVSFLSLSFQIEFNQQKIRPFVVLWDELPVGGAAFRGTIFS